MEILNKVLEWLLNNREWLWSILSGTSLVTIASAIANWTKGDADNKALSLFSKIINYLALNFFNVKK